MVNILLCDDHPSVGEGTKNMIEQEEDMVVTVTTTGNEAIDHLKNNTVDVALLDLNMPNINGIQLTRRAIAINSDTSILIYTGYDISPHFNTLIEAGISGFVSKTASREQLINAIRCALRGEAVIPIALLKKLRKNSTSQQIQSESDGIKDITINERELDILREVKAGKSNQAIAQQLSISQRNVEFGLTRIFGKLNVRSRYEAIQVALRLGLIDEEEMI